MNAESASHAIPITAIVMTLNEERNICACLDSIAEHVDQIILVDSFSTDSTVQIAKRYGAQTHQHEFVNQAQQFIWALENCDIRNDWILRIDADERWTLEGVGRLREVIENDTHDGVSVRMKIYFMNRWLQHGGLYPNQFMRAFKRSRGSMENRWMDEHIRVDGRVLHSDIDVIESNYDRQREISLWTTKHNSYATREAIEQLALRHKLAGFESIANLRGNGTQRKRWLKENIYSRAPLFLRPYLYFNYRYFAQLGFLDGKESFVFHTLHAFWYRFLVDAKVYQIEKNASLDGLTIPETVKKYWGLHMNSSDEKTPDRRP